MMEEASRSHGRRIGYIKVRHLSGAKATQLENIQLDIVFTDRIDRKHQFLAQFELMMSYAREGDTLFVEEMSRLGRNPDEFLYNVRELTQRGIRIECTAEGIIFPAGEDSPLRNLILFAMELFHRTAQSWVSDRHSEARIIDPDFKRRQSLNRTVEINEQDFGK